MTEPLTIILQDAKHGRWLRFSRPVEVVQAGQVDEVLPALERVEAGLAAGMYAAGMIAYEAAPAFDPALETYNSTPGKMQRSEGSPTGQGLPDFPLVWFGLYPAPEIVELPDESDTGYMLGEWTPSVSRPEYDAAIGRVKERIARGDTYQVNYTMRLRAGFSGDAWALFLRLARAQQAQYAAYLDLGDFAVCSASPELFFTWEDGRLASKPMKGTAARGRILADDRRQAEWLQNSEKNRAENVMIVDMIRNDLGRIAETGSVCAPRLFDVERYPTVWQMTSTVEAESRAGLTDILKALFPCASITGAPKVSTMRIISELETAPRRIYTGCIGFVTPQQRAQFNVAIRTVLVDRRLGLAEYGVGGGIVWDLTPAEEFEECQVKARLLTTTRPVFALLESLLWTPSEGYFLLDAHLRRIADSAEYFGYPCDRAAARALLEKQEEALPPRPHKVRVLLDRRGELSIEAIPLAPPPGPAPVQVALARQPVSSGEVFLYHKTTHRDVYAQASRGLPAGCEPLLWNERGELTESATANIVVRMDGKLLTPPVSSGLLAGTFRALLLARGEIEEGILRVDELPRCEAIWLINSVRKWRKADLADHR